MRAVAPEIRFSQNYTVDHDGCWIWNLSKNNKGYAQFKVYGKMVKVHRWAYTFFVGEILEGYDIDHKCHSSAPWCVDIICKHRACVNPAHLEAVSRGEHGSRSRHAQKDRCIHGHLYSDENTRWYNGHRFCRQCASTRQYNQKKLISA